MGGGRGGNGGQWSRTLCAKRCWVRLKLRELRVEAAEARTLEASMRCIVDGGWRMEDEAAGERKEEITTPKPGAPRTPSKVRDRCKARKRWRWRGSAVVMKEKFKNVRDEESRLERPCAARPVQRILAIRASCTSAAILHLRPSPIHPISNTGRGHIAQMGLSMSAHPVSPRARAAGVSSASCHSRRAPPHSKLGANLGLDSPLHTRIDLLTCCCSLSSGIPQNSLDLLLDLDQSS